MQNRMKKKEEKNMCRIEERKKKVLKRDIQRRMRDVYPCLLSSKVSMFIYMLMSWYLIRVKSVSLSARLWPRFMSCIIALENREQIS